MTETALIRSIRSALQLAFPRCKVLRLNAGTLVLGKGKDKRVLRGVEPGTPDLLVLIPGGRVCWIECKTMNGRVSPEQKRWHAEAEHYGHHVYVCRSVSDAISCVELERAISAGISRDVDSMRARDDIRRRPAREHDNA